MESFSRRPTPSTTAKKNVRILESADSRSARLVGSSYSLQKVYNTIKMAAPTDATVLITGESGVGKGSGSRRNLPALQPQRQDLPVKVNCASIPANLLESELFGYEPGAFSGANSSGKQGLFEMANGGTLLLDEIGDMPFDMQVKLLRAIQNKEITRVGGTKPIKLDIRIIAATNSDLKRKISEGTFRQDLYYRLNVIPIYIPPLRERLNDLDDLCDHFVAFFTEKHGRAFTPDRRSESHHEAVHLARQHPRAGERHRIPDHLRLRDQKRWLMKCSAACWTSPRATKPSPLPAAAPCPSP